MFGKVLKFSYITSELALCKLSQWFMVCFGISPLLNICSYNFSITKKEKRFIVTTFYSSLVSLKITAVLGCNSHTMKVTHQSFLVYSQGCTTIHYITPEPLHHPQEKPYTRQQPLLIFPLICQSTFYFYEFVYSRHFTKMEQSFVSGFFHLV